MQARELQSQVITFLRFPLAVAVIMLHASFSDVISAKQLNTSFEEYNFIFELLWRTIFQIAVPLFFLISGYLFFCNVDSFDVKTYGRKLKKRAKTLLVPYLIWNLLMLVVMYTGQQFFPSMMSGNSMLVSEFRLKDWLLSFWDISYRTGGGLSQPANGALWFIRDLMIVMVLSPLIHACIKYFKFIGVIILIVVYLFGVERIFDSLSMTAVLFFTLGSWFGINKKEFVVCCKPTIIFLLTSVYILMAVIYTILSNETFIWNFVNRILIVLGTLLTPSFVAYFIRTGKWKINKFLAGSSFFLFAYHFMILGVLKRLLWDAVNPKGDMGVIGLYILVSSAVVLCGILFYWWLKKHCRCVAMVITGGR